MILPEPSKTDSGAAEQSAPGAAGRTLLGYWHNWQSRSAAFIPLRSVPPQYDVIHVAFAISDPTRPGSMLFMPHGEAGPAGFKSEVEHLQQSGRKVVLSIGGANGSPAMVDEAARRNFVHSVIDLVCEYGFDGIDINLEGKVRLDGDDTDLQNPRSPSIVRLIEAVRGVRSSFGDDFMLSLTPEAINVQGGYRLYGQVCGAYLPVIQGLRDVLSYVQVQHYNSVPILALDGRLYSQGSADFLVALTDMLLRGFPLSANGGGFFAGLKPEQIVIGLPAAAEASRGGFTAPAEICKALEYLARGRSFGGRYALEDLPPHAAPRGVMLWSINWDAADGGRFSREVRESLNRLPPTLKRPTPPLSA